MYPGVYKLPVDGGKKRNKQNCFSGIGAYNLTLTAIYALFKKIIFYKAPQFFSSLLKTINIKVPVLPAILL